MRFHKGQKVIVRNMYSTRHTTQRDTEATIITVGRKYVTTSFGTQQFFGDTGRQTGECRYLLLSLADVAFAKEIQKAEERLAAFGVVIREGTYPDARNKSQKIHQVAGLLHHAMEVAGIPE